MHSKSQSGREFVSRNAPRVHPFPNSAQGPITNLTCLIHTVQVLATVIYCLFAAGIVFGYAALKPVLKKEGAYRDVCGAGDSSSSPDDVDTCVEIRLNLMFTVAAVSTNVAALPIGTILDHFGPRVCGLSGALFLTVGSLLMAFEESLPFDGLLVGYLFLALGGPFTYISSFQLSNAFPKHSGLILALLTGAFDASSALFLVYRVIFEKTGGAFGHDKFFLAYLVVPVVIAVLQFILLPKHSYKTIGEMIEQVDQPLPRREDQVDENTALLEQERIEHRDAIAADLEDLLGSVRADKQQQKEEKKNDISGVWGVMHPYTAWQQIKSPWFIFICAFTGVYQTKSALRQNVLTDDAQSGPNDKDQLLRGHYPATVRGPSALPRPGCAGQRIFRFGTTSWWHSFHPLHRPTPRPLLHRHSPLLAGHRNDCHRCLWSHP